MATWIKQTEICRQDRTSFVLAGGHYVRCGCLPGKPQCKESHCPRCDKATK